MDRRGVLRAAAGLGGVSLLGGCASTGPVGASAASLAPGASARIGPLPPVRASMNRLFDITVCLRPFRAAGPRLDAERIGDALVVHNYGHGGSGWSLSWGSSALAVRSAMAGSPAEVAVVGCGALGLTSAILAQQAGARVTIYARDLLPDTYSARATGMWTPDSRIALTAAAGPGFEAVWGQMARTSFHAYRRYLGLPGTPVEWVDRYTLSDVPWDQWSARQVESPRGFASYHTGPDVIPHGEALAPGTAPFPTPYVRRSTSLIFNIAEYGRTLMSEFREGGGRLVRREFHDPSELGTLPQKVVLDCPGYGARALWRDASIIPVRGQIGWLTPQPELTYGLYYNDVSTVPRRDGIVVQALEGGDDKGFGIDDDTPDRAETERAIATLASLYARPGWR